MELHVCKPCLQMIVAAKVRAPFEFGIGSLSDNARKSATCRTKFIYSAEAIPVGFMCVLDKLAKPRRDGLRKTDAFNCTPKIIQSVEIGIILGQEFRTKINAK